MDGFFFVIYLLSFVILCILLPAFKALVHHTSREVSGKQKTETLLLHGGHSLVQTEQFALSFFQHKWISHILSALPEESNTFDFLAYQQGQST